MSTNLLSNATSGEVNGVATNVLNGISSSALEDANLKVLTSKLEAHNKELTKALNKKASSDLTDDVWHYEDLRDRGLKCLFYSIYGATFHSNVEISDSAVVLYDVIERHGKTIYNLPMNEQSSKMASLFNELSGTKMQEALTRTNTSSLLENVIAVNQQFHDTMAQRLQEETAKEKIMLVTDAKKLVRSDIDNISTYMDTLSTISDSKEFKGLNQQITDIMIAANSSIKMRKTMRNKD